MIALATCRDFPELYDDDRPLLAALDGRAVPAVWDDPAVDWDAFELVVVRETWDYTDRRDEFLAWCDRIGDRLRNSPEVMRWSTDKRYLAELAGAGLPVVPTKVVAPGDGEPFAPPLVVKPAVGAGTRDALRHDDPVGAAAHVERLHGAGHVALAQPYLPAVEDAGETALIYLAGAYSHAIRKGPLLAPDLERDGSGLFVSEDITPREPSGAEREVGDRVMAWVRQRFGDLLYARIDLLPGDMPRILEVELAEPSLFLAHAPGAAERMAAALS